MHLFIRISAIVLLLLGLLGMILPVIPGIPFLVIGIILLGEESPLGQWIISKLPSRIKDLIRKQQQKLPKK